MANNVLKEELVLNSGQFDKNINNVIRKVEELKHKGAKVGDGFNGSMSKMIERATGFNGSLRSIVGIVGKFGGALGAITAGVNLADWFSNAVSEGTKLAEEAEGVRLAFERLNRGDLLAKLREETHGTVTDLELMKQAVKFNDFNLNLNEMGKFLAFAQMKAKDTGESIDYMVDSIVTGLGRKSLPILDNLGLSAVKIKEYMKDGGDMTTAVAKIIEEKMKEAGDYVETASDRAKRKEVELENALTELGRTFQPLKETSSDFFHSIEIGAINAINSLRPLINQFTELGRVMNNFNKIGGDEKVNRMINNLGDDPKKAKKTYDAQLKEFERYRQKLKNKIAAYKFSGGKDAIDRSHIQDLEEQIKSVDKMEAEYRRKAQNWYNGKTKKQVPEVIQSETNNAASGGRGGKTTKGGNTPIYAVGSVGYYEKLISDLQKEIKLQVDASEIEKLQNQIKEAQTQLDLLLNPQKLNLTKIEGISSFSNLKLDVSIPTEPIVKDFTTIYKEASEQINKILDAYDMGVIGHDKAQEWIDEVNRTLKANKLKPIDVEVRTDTQKMFDNLQNKANSLVAGFEGIDTVISNINDLSDAIDNGANAWQIFMRVLQTGISVINGISSVLETVNTLTELFGTTSLVAAEQNAAAGASEMATAAGVTAAKSGEAIAGATASGAKMPFPYNLIAIAAGVAAVVAALATITGAFANGGVVGGSQYAGDALLARVNSGEMILNGSQQKNLFNLLDKGTTNNVPTGNVNFVIRGKDLHGVLSNYDDKMKKVR